MRLNCRVALSDPSNTLWALPYNCTLSDVRKGASRDFGIALGESGGILTQPLSSSYHLFSNLHGNRVNIGDFNDLACFNSFNLSA